jgi:hypothetical protein
MSTQNALAVAVAGPRKLFDVSKLFQEPQGAYFTQKIRRSIKNTTPGTLVRETQTQELILDACTGAVPALLHGNEIQHGSARRDDDVYTMTVQWKAGNRSRWSAMGANAEKLLGIAEKMYLQHKPLKDGEQRVEIPEGKKIVALNATGISLNPYSNNNRNNGTAARSTQNWDKNRITADMAMMVQELEVVYEDGSSEVIFGIPNAAGAVSATATSEEDPFAA